MRWEHSLPVADFSSASLLRETSSNRMPETMRAAVYQGEGRVSVEKIDVPVPGAGEALIRVETCGICHTDLKKIEYDLLPGPRIYGHETAGVVVAGRRYRRGRR